MSQASRAFDLRQEKGSAHQGAVSPCAEAFEAGCHGAMSDVLYPAILAVFFTLCWLMVKVMDR